ncbi:MAG: SpoIIE family protein phosphatase [Firmicutes bacterium]|nr:SpoIIE family protein phosphatase [Bacillota bacterium]
MRKIYGLTLGGLQQKIFNLVLISIILIIAVFIGAAYYQTAKLTKVVGDARNGQQAAIKQVSEETMHKVVDGSLTKVNALQAYIADDMFADVKSDVMTMQTLAAELFDNRDALAPYPVYPPDKANEGSISSQVLCESGVDYRNSEYLKVASHMAATLEAMYKNSGKLSNCYIGLADGTLLCVDEHAANKFDENGNIIPFPVRDRSWYKNAASSGKLYFSGIEEDTYTKKIGVTCAAPVYSNGQLVAVVGADIFLEAMSEYVNASTAEGGFICVVNNDGQIIFAPENNGIFEVETSDEAEDLRSSENKELADFVTAALNEKTGLCVVNAGDRICYMTGTPISSVGWAVISVVDKAVTEMSANQLLDEYDKINLEASGQYEQGKTQSLAFTMLILALVFITALYAAQKVAGRILEPVESMTKNIIHTAETGEYFEMKDLYKTGDEIEVLAEAFNDLSQKTKQYIEHITEITKEKERISTELDLARRIQADMLPNIYPPFPERPELDIYATMTPAKEVGGDFYDFFLIDDDHLGMVMADVSGKGVPAALFMMMSKILINDFAMQGASPAKVLEETNAVICRNNEEEMFVTVWFGVMEISTGKIKAANAGHEYPIIRKANGEFELFKDKHGFVIGGMEGIRYKEYDMQLEKGGTLFLYTDGVPEATDTHDNMFGTERLLKVLDKNKDTDSRELLTKIKLSVDEFVGDGDQFDDLTMLAITLL